MASVQTLRDALTEYVTTAGAHTLEWDEGEGLAPDLSLKFRRDDRDYLVVISEDLRESYPANQAEIVRQLTKQALFERADDLAMQKKGLRLMTEGAQILERGSGPPFWRVSE